MAPSGGGKTYGALRLATGMAEEIEKETGKKARILMGNTEQKRGYYYANEFNYDIVDIDAPHEPEKYVDFINFAVEEGYDIVIIDSSSHEWEGKGGCLELHQRAGGTYQSWAKVTPRHNKFINAIADSPIHIIATMRGKDAYETSKDEKGKMQVQKIGIGAKQRDGFEYEFTCTFLIDQKTSTSEAQKDNTHIFDNEGPVKLSEEHGRKIIQWANSGEGYTPVVREEDETVSDPLKPVLDDVVSLANSLYKEHKEVLDIVKKYAGGNNPRTITELDKAQALLAELKEI